MSSHCYRFSQSHNSFDGVVRGDVNLPGRGYVNADDSLFIRGWVVSTAGRVRRLRVTVYGAARDELPLIENLLPSPDIQQRFPEYEGSARARFQIDQSVLNMVLDGNDAAIELSAEINGTWYRYKVITFVRDEKRNPTLFIVGSPRSGTSILNDSIRKILDSTATHGESHILPLAVTLGVNVKKYFDDVDVSVNRQTMLSHLCPELVSEQLSGVIKKQYEISHPDGWIIDKTPGSPMICALPTIQRLWPDSKIIFSTRRGIENVASRMKKFPEVDFATHCRQWAGCMDAWHHRKGALTNTIEVDQFDILTNPVAVSSDLARFLALDQVQQEQLLQHLTHDRPEMTGGASTIAAKHLDGFGWTDQQKLSFLDICHASMQRAGYCDTEQYYSEREPSLSMAC